MQWGGVLHFQPIASLLGPVFPSLRALSGRLLNSRRESDKEEEEAGLTRKTERASIKVTPSVKPITIPTMFSKPLARANGGTCAEENVY